MKPPKAKPPPLESTNSPVQVQPEALLAALKGCGHPSHYATTDLTDRTSPKLDAALKSLMEKPRSSRCWGK